MDTMFEFCIFSKGNEYVGVLFALLQSIHSLYKGEIPISILYADTDGIYIDEIKKRLSYITLVETKIRKAKKGFFVSEKMKYWNRLIQCSRENNIVLIDSDTLVIKDISEVFECQFDIGFTYKNREDDDQPQWPINTGVVFVKKNNRIIKLFEAWERKTLHYVNRNEKESDDELCKKWGGLDQAALGNLMGGAKDRERYKHLIYNNNVVFKGFPCEVYNEIKNDITKKTKILHYKNRWHKVILKEREIPNKGNVRIKFNIWQGYRMDWEDQDSTLPISVVMSVYNQEKYIREAISSVLNQTFEDFELIIIDDKSTDRTLSIIESISDKRIKIISNTYNKGLTCSLNIAIETAKGKYIARLDGDDRMRRNRLEIQYNYLKSNPSIALCGSRCNVIDFNGIVTRQAGVAMESRNDFLKFLLWDNCLIHSSAMFRRKTFMDIGGYDEKIVRAQDYALWIEFYKESQVISLNDILIDWRDHKENISQSKRKEQQQSALKTSLAFLRHTFPELKDISDKALSLIRGKFIHYYRSEKGPNSRDNILRDIELKTKTYNGNNGKSL